MKAALKSWIPPSLVVQRLPASSARSILLTFDDGPDPKVTPGVLERLAKYDATAVFFIIGKRIRRAPALLPAIQSAGHLIGNHSLLHRDGFVIPGPDSPTFGQYLRDCARCQAVIERRGGHRPMLFRPPGGRLSFASVFAPRLLGLRCMTWSQDVNDWAFRSAAEARDGARTLMTQIKPRDIVLLHDDNVWVLDLLDALLPALKADDYDLNAAVTGLTGHAGGAAGA